jgi:hypothetical protein
VGPLWRHLVLAAGVATMLGVILALLLIPIWQSAADTLAERLLNTYYTATSAMILIPAILLVRFFSHFRGGRIIWAWSTMMIGWVAILIADILFAYKTIAELDPLLVRTMTVIYLAGYLVLCRGILFHRQLITAEETEIY